MSSAKHPALRPVKSPTTTLRAITAMVIREMVTTYGRSPGGYVWAVLEPAAGIALLTLIFSTGFRTPPLGTNFALFYASGMLPFLMYSELTNKLGQTIQFSRALLNYPRVTFIDALAARFLLNTMTLLLVHCAVLGFIIFVQDPNTSFDFQPIVISYLMVFSISIGFGTLNSFLTLAYPLWQTAWAIANRPMFLISSIFFTFESVPQPYSDYLWFNPLVHVVGVMRDGFYPFYHPTFISYIYPFALSAVACITGLFLLNRYHRDILNR